MGISRIEYQSAEAFNVVTDVIWLSSTQRTLLNGMDTLTWKWSS